VRSAVSPEGRPYTPGIIMKALHEAHVNVKNRPIDEQINEIIDHLRKVLPLQIEIKKVKLRIPVLYTANYSRQDQRSDWPLCPRNVWIYECLNESDEFCEFLPYNDCHFTWRNRKNY
jgi:hypothetical protein